MGLNPHRYHPNAGRLVQHHRATLQKPFPLDIALPGPRSPQPPAPPVEGRGQVVLDAIEEAFGTAAQEVLEPYLSELYDALYAAKRRVVYLESRLRELGIDEIAELRARRRRAKGAP